MEQHKKRDNRYKPPKFPVITLLSTFIAPVMTVVLPIIFKQEYDLKNNIIIALALLSACLLIVCFGIILTSYDLYYRLQMISDDLDASDKSIKLMQECVRVIQEVSNKTEKNDDEGNHEPSQTTT